MTLVRLSKTERFILRTAGQCGAASVEVCSTLRRARAFDKLVRLGLLNVDTRSETDIGRKLNELYAVEAGKVTS